MAPKGGIGMVSGENVSFAPPVEVTSNTNRENWGARVGSVLKRVTAVGLTGAGIAFSAVVVESQPAQASVGCYGDWCSGKDPNATGCANDGRTVATAPVTEKGWSIGVGPVSGDLGGQTIGEIEVRWSDTCRSNWARLNLFDEGNVRQLTLRQMPDNGGYEQNSQLLGKFQYELSPGLYWTPMIYSPGKAVRAFATLAGSIQHPSTPWV